MTNKANTFIEEKELMREVHGATLNFYNEKIIEMSLSKIDEYIQLINFCKSNNIKEKVLNAM
jgi:hypothetical protein